MQRRNRDSNTAIPYGPTTGIVEGLALLQRLSPPRVDADLLRSHRIAPGNEYKVVGALRFLGVIDGAGHPTPHSRLLKTRGTTLTQALQEMLRSSYADLFAALDLSHATRQDVYNYFVARASLGAEMASKAARSFLELCRRAQLPLSPALAAAPRRGRPPRLQEVPPTRSSSEARGRPSRASQKAHPAQQPAESPPLLLAITAEIATMDQEALTEVFRKIRIALQRSVQE